mmetsp:Transcript_1885/g.4775  ORF Transcript_1885/g.4775 Transcript_1885/m.4775 type:complete len:82 (-) Transcript_1885:279-524(-)
MCRSSELSAKNSLRRRAQKLRPPCFWVTFSGDYGVVHAYGYDGLLVCANRAMPATSHAGAEHSRGCALGVCTCMPNVVGKG